MIQLEPQVLRGSSAGGAELGSPRRPGSGGLAQAGMLCCHPGRAEGQAFGSETGAALGAGQAESPASPRAHHARRRRCSQLPGVPQSCDVVSSSSSSENGLYAAPEKLTVAPLLPQAKEGMSSSAEDPNPLPLIPWPSCGPSSSTPQYPPLCLPSSIRGR